MERKTNKQTVQNLDAISAQANDMEHNTNKTRELICDRIKRVIKVLQAHIRSFGRHVCGLISGLLFALIVLYAENKHTQQSNNK